MSWHDALIAATFNATFAPSRVTMRGGGSEPAYTPATAIAPALLVYTHDYASSALHEAAHWCLAGARRRRLPDFGYRYVPAGLRSDADQLAFEREEAATQAIEWFLSLAASVHFHVSLDQADRRPDVLRGQVLTAVAARLDTALPPRAKRFHAALADRFGGLLRPRLDDFLAVAGKT